jgi:hypothetical protein
MEDQGTPPPAPAPAAGRSGRLPVLVIALLVAGGVLWWVFAWDGGGAGPAARIVVEAESGIELTEPLKQVADDQASGGACLALPSPGCADGKHLHPADGPAAPGRVAGSAQVPFRVATEGEYSLWIRTWWCCAEGDAFVVELDGGRSYIFGDDGADFRKWSWRDLREGGRQVRFRLAAGRHVLLIRTRGESGFKIDQLLFTTDGRFRPKGIAKP